MAVSDQNLPEDSLPASSRSAVAVLLPVFVLLAYVAFLIAGFGSGLGTWQPVPIYAFASLVVLTEAAYLAQNRSVAALLYVSATMLVAAVFAGVVVFGNTKKLAPSPAILVASNVLITAVVVCLASINFMQSKQQRAAAGSATPVQGFSSTIVASGFLSLAVVCFVEFALLAYLAAGQGVRVDLPVPAPVNHLETLDLVIAIGATIIGWLLLLGIGDILPVAVVVSAIALLSANDIFGVIKILGVTGAVTRSPYAYLGLNLLLVILAITANLRARRPVILKLGPWKLVFRPRKTITGSRMATLAVGSASTSMLFFVAWGLEQVLSNRNYVHVDLNHLFGLTLPSPLNHLETLDLGIAIGAALISLALTTVDAFRGLDALLQRVRLAASHMPVTLRVVFGPFVWLVPSTCAAVGAQQIVGFFNRQAQLSSTPPSAGTIIALFNPFASLGDYGILVGFGLLIAAFVSATFALALIELNEALFVRMARVLLLTGRVVAVTLALFVYSLATVNAVINLVSLDGRQPFRLGALESLGLVTASVLILTSAWQRRR